MTSAFARRSSRLLARPCVAALLSLGASWLAPRAAHAQSAATLDLRWSAPVGCPQQGEVRERIRKLMGGANSKATTLQAEGTITQTDRTHFRLQLVMRSGNLVGERSLDAASCVNLSGAAAVTLALLMRSGEPPNAAGTVAQQATEVAGSSTPPTTATTSNTDKSPEHAKATGKAEESPQTRAGDDRDAAPSPDAGSLRPWRVLAQVPLVALSVGTLPDPSWGVAFAGGVSYEHWRLTLAAGAWRSQPLAAPNPYSNYGADVNRVTGTLTACRAFRRAALELAPCLVFSLEHVSARGSGPRLAAQSASATWLAVGAGAQARLYLTDWLSVLLGVDARIETARPRISIDQVGELRQLGAAAFTVTMGPEWIL